MPVSNKRKRKWDVDESGARDVSEERQYDSRSGSGLSEVDAGKFYFCRLCFPLVPI